MDIEKWKEAIEICEGVTLITYNGLFGGFLALGGIIALTLFAIWNMD